MIPPISADRRKSAGLLKSAGLVVSEVAQPKKSQNIDQKA
jgi:hypothetical protein